MRTNVYYNEKYIGKLKKAGTILCCLLTFIELENLPKVHRTQITLTRFLGSGAFGEVFEGLMKGSPAISYMGASPMTSPNMRSTNAADVTTNGNNNVDSETNDSAEQVDMLVPVASSHVPSEVPGIDQRKIAVKTLRKGNESK